MPDSNANPGKITALLPLQLCVVAALLGIVAFRVKVWSAVHVAGLCLAVPAAVLLFTARWQLGHSFSVTPQARALVTHGLYSKIRNPIYVFSALFVLGFLLALGFGYFALIFLLLVVPIQIFRAGQESQVLEARFGDQYREYRKGTWF